MQMALMDTFNRVENKSLLMGNHAVHHNCLFLNICLYVLHECNLRQVIVHAKHPGQRRQQQNPRQHAQDDVVHAFHAPLLNMPKEVFVQ